MAKMTPEQEAAYALGFGVVSSDLPPEAQLAYDRLVEQQARAAASAPVPPPDAGATIAPPSVRISYDPQADAAWRSQSALVSEYSTSPCSMPSR
jgi:hypothetical protein